MRKLLILLAVFVFIVAYAVPAMTIPRASPTILVNDIMLASTAMAAHSAPATSSPLITSCLVVTPRAMATATTLMKSDRIWNQVALDANYNYPGRPICLTGALISNEDTPRISAKVSEDVISVTLTGNQTLMSFFAVHNPTENSVVDVAGMTDLMVQGSRHVAGSITLIDAYNIRYGNASLISTTWAVQEDGTLIQVRSISAIHLCLAPVAYGKANEFSFGQERQEQQRAACNYCNLPTTLRMADSNIIGANRIGTVSRL